MGNFLRRRSQDSETQNRTFDLNVPQQQYGTNQIKSTTSSVFTFIPLNLLHQFKNLPNLYFLLIVVLQMIPQISVTGGQPTTLIPLSFVILTVMVKDAYQEFLRFLKDREQNQRKVQILRNGGFQQQAWQDLMSGHVFKVKQDQLIPCDALVLKTNLPQNKCFMETKNLDGQTNLKSRKAPVSKYNLDKLSNQSLSQERFQICVQQPNEYLNNIKGFMKVKDQNVAISIQNCLLRGCHLRNCAEAICVALYVGSDTKVIINSAKFSAKKSKMMSEIDKMVMSIFVWQIMIALVVSIFNTLFENSYSNYVSYFGTSKFWLLVPSWWLLMTYFVPISLIVTMQLIKLFQGGIINKDKRGYSKQYNCYISSNNTSINQNLGQIKYVFTDKTGTLTKNEMNFKKIIVDGQKYGERSDVSKQQIKNKYPKTTNVNFADSSFFKKTEQKRYKQMLEVIYLCHDVFVDKKSDGRLIYNSGSPDQIALINFAKLCGKQLIGQEYGYVKIMDHKTKNTIKYKKLCLLEFSSDRKRMSVIVRTPENQILMITKGADSAVQKILGNKKEHLQKTNKILQDYSVQGLRTLMLARRIIPEDQYNRWQQKYKKAASSIKDRQKSLENVYKEIQKDLQLVGGTAVQDKLQDDVQKTIINMKNAGIKFFILTGDKKQTAVNIGRSAGLIAQRAKIISYPEEYDQEAKYQTGDKVYLIDASDQLPELPPDLFHHQTICYRCTPIQKQNIVKYVKQRTPDLTLAIGDGANDVNMITCADVGIGVKGKQGTQATRVSDVSIGEFKFLAFITLYYGRQWYRRNADLACYNFYKNWYHVSAVIIYGAYSYFSAVQIFDIYLYELFNAFFAALPIIIYAIFDQQYTYQESMRFPQLYSPGLLNSYFNQNVYYKNIGQGLFCGFVSIIIIFMTLEDDVLSADSRTGYFAQSGAVLFFNIIIIVNLKILVMSNGITVGLILSILISITMYWIIYFLETLYFSDFVLRYSFYQQWQTPQILFLHLLLIFMFSVSQFAYRMFYQFKERGNRVIRQKHANPIIAALAEKIFTKDS